MRPLGWPMLSTAADAGLASLDAADSAAAATGTTRWVVVAHPGAELYGSDRMLLESVRGFRAEGISVVVALPGEGALAELLRAEGVDVCLVRMAVLRKAALRPAGLARLVLEALRSLLPTFRLLRRHPGAALYVSTLTIPGWLLVGRLAGRHVVCHVHEAERHGGRILQTLLALPLLAAHRIVVNSRFSGSVITDAIPRLAWRSRVVYNGVSLTHDVPAADEVGDGPLRVLFLGRLSPRKGPDIAASALREVRRRGVDAELDVVGSVFPGYEWFSTELRALNQDLVDAGALRFHDFTDDTTEALSRAHVVVVPSTAPEPFGNTAVEAMLAGRPVVVSRSGGLPEAVAGSPSAQTVEAGSVEQLATALVRVRREWEGMRDDAATDRPRVEARFSPRSYRQEVVSALRAE